MNPGVWDQSRKKKRQVKEEKLWNWAALAGSDLPVSFSWVISIKLTKFPFSQTTYTFSPWKDWVFDRYLSSCVYHMAFAVCYSDVMHHTYWFSNMKLTLNFWCVRGPYTWYIIYLFYLWILFATNLIRVFSYIFIQDLLSCDIFISMWYIYHISQGHIGSDQIKKLLQMIKCAKRSKMVICCFPFILNT